MSDKDKQLKIWDITVPGRDDLTKEKVAEVLESWASKWAFQLEEGKKNKDETDEKDEKNEGKEEKKRGYVHWQIRVCLHKKERIGPLRKMIKESALHGGWATKTSKDVAEEAKRGIFRYIIKSQTRLEGPWTNETANTLKPEAPDIKRCRANLYPYQKEILEQMDSKEEPTRINVICNPTGQIGKSTLRRIIRWDNKHRVVPPAYDAAEMIANVMCMPEAKAYLCDIPRQQNEKKAHLVWAGIEELANGHVWDKRHVFKDRIMWKPHIWVMTNMHPDEVFKMLSVGRINVFIIGVDKTLIPWDKEDGPILLEIIDEERKKEVEEAEKREKAKVKRPLSSVMQELFEKKKKQRVELYVQE